MVNESVLPYVWMLVGSVAFAVMGTLAHTVGQTCDWQVVALVRASLACLFAIVLARAADATLVFRRPLILWVRSISGSVSMVCTFYAFANLPVSDVLTLTNTFPIWVALLCWPLYGEVPGVSVWISVASGVAGVVLIQQPHFAEGNFAALVALISSFFTAIAMLGLHKLYWIDARAIVAHFSGVAVLFCLASCFAFERAVPMASAFEWQNVLLLLGVGATATAGQLCLTRAFGAGPPTKVSVVGLTQIVFAMLLDAVLFQRRFDAMTLAGIGLVVAPTAWLLSRPRMLTTAAAEAIETMKGSEKEG
ncbi:MAG: DMT family transporter [Gemmataceae bacterium]|nr:DMT family transporter [Gemmataceae bacterium]